MSSESSSKAWACAATAAGALTAALLYANLTGGEARLEKRLRRRYDVDSGSFERSLSALLGPEVQGGNQATLLRNGDEIFPAMLEAIAQARSTICLETFIYWSGDIGSRFAEALAERARAGVCVHVMLDWIGSLHMDDRLIRRMRDSGVQVVRYHRPRLRALSRLNKRTHRKLLIVDGAVGFTGGVGIADCWLGHAQDPEHWRDSHFRVVGPVVAQMQAVFIDNWIKATGAVLHGDDYFPLLEPRGAMRAQMFSCSPSSGSARMRLMYLLSIVSARRTWLLQSAYFVPDAMAVDLLCQAARRGVDVRIIVPGSYTDAPIVRHASRTLWPRLMQAGIRIAQYQGTMFHCKVLVADGLLVSVGSTNFDERSFKLNDEANLNVLDAEFARQQEQVFEEDWARSRPMREADLHPGLLPSLVDDAASVLRHQL